MTLSNGPGHIPACSVLRISTSTGLEFSSVSPSSVFVYSPNKKDEPKEGAMQIELENSSKSSALMYLPECGAYEMVDLFFDVLAPVESSDLIGHMAKHEVSRLLMFLPLPLRPLMAISSVNPQRVLPAAHTMSL